MSAGFRTLPAEQVCNSPQVQQAWMTQPVQGLGYGFNDQTIEVRFLITSKYLSSTKHRGHI
jgi:hypothetical protein